MTSSYDYRQLADRMRELTADTQRIRADYDQAEVTAVSPDGSARVVMRAGKLSALTIDPGAMAHDNVYVANQVLAAIRQAEQQSEQFLTARARPMADAVEQLRGLFPQ
ncbi:YbaB/EbfC family nucleoid-associated protein [Actinoplanes sp. NPDC048796]|uniref:YbaB/EbfC family nucleoid-associated protein n=1 Tax=unclassified Actinoplanes TaxID=2626549 RepID=UPI003405CC2A